MKILTFIGVLMMGIASVKAAHLGGLETTEEEKIEINHKELPQGIRDYIFENFPGAEILKIYKTMKDTDHTGYLVEIKDGDEKHTLFYDKDDIPKSKGQDETTKAPLNETNNK